MPGLSGRVAPSIRIRSTLCIRLDDPIFHGDDPVKVLLVPFLVGDHDDGLVEIPVQLPEQVEDHLRVPGVQVGTGFIGKEEGRPVHERPGDRHPLLLAAGQLGGEVMDPVAQSHDPEDISADQRALLGGHPPGHGGEVDVLLGGQFGDQGIVLEDIPEPSEAKHRPGSFIPSTAMDS